jgi:hypothetical protein
MACSMRRHFAENFHSPLNQSCGSGVVTECRISEQEVQGSNLRRVAFCFLVSLSKTLNLTCFFQPSSNSDGPASHSGGVMLLVTYCYKIWDKLRLWWAVIGLVYPKSVLWWGNLDSVGGARSQDYILVFLVNLILSLDTCSLFCLGLKDFLLWSLMTTENSAQYVVVLPGFQLFTFQSLSRYVRWYNKAMITYTIGIHIPV